MAKKHTKVQNFSAMTVFSKIQTHNGIITCKTTNVYTIFIPRSAQGA